MLWIQRFLQLIMDPSYRRAGGLFPPRLLGKADAVLAGDHAVPSKNLGEKLVQGAIDFPARSGAGYADHQVDVNVAVAGMAEGSDSQAEFLFKFFGKFEKIYKPAAGDRYILVHFHQSGRFQ